MNSENDIPNEVQALGPMWQSLPRDITMRILAETLLMQPIFQKHGGAVNHNWFQILTGLGRFIKFRQYCKPHPRFLMQAFYEANNFVFERSDQMLTRNQTAPAPFLPPPICRSYLRRMQITLVLEDFYTLPPHPPYGHYCLVHSVDEFFQHSPGARCLSTLTHPSTGFSRLDSLDLTIHTNFRRHRTEGLALVEAAGFKLRAGKITITVPFQGCLGPDNTHWLPQIAEIIELDGVRVY